MFHARFIPRYEYASQDIDCMGAPMVGLNFEKPPVGDATTDISTECQRQLLPLIDEIVQAAVAAGWNQNDVLLALVELTWDLYEDRRADL
jgi:hypothetical protein